MSYVDLNPVRAGLAETSETSDFTSVQQRIGERTGDGEQSDSSAEKPKLMPLDIPCNDTHPNAFAFDTDDYLQLVDWAGRAVRDDKRGAISSTRSPVLQRLQIDPERYLNHVRRGGRHHHVAAMGHADRLREAAERLGRCFLKGLGHSRALYLIEV